MIGATFLAWLLPIAYFVQSHDAENKFRPVNAHSNRCTFSFENRNKNGIETTQIHNNIYIYTPQLELILELFKEGGWLKYFAINYSFPRIGERKSRSAFPFRTTPLGFWNE